MVILIVLQSTGLFVLISKRSVVNSSLYQMQTQKKHILDVLRCSMYVILVSGPSWLTAPNNIHLGWPLENLGSLSQLGIEVLVGLTTEDQQTEQFFIAIISGIQKFLLYVDIYSTGNISQVTEKSSGIYTSRPCFEGTNIKVFPERPLTD